VSAKRELSMQTFRFVLILMTVFASGGSPVSSQENKQNHAQESIVKPASIERQVTFKSDDGWTIHGTYTVPADYKEGERLPAALLLHSSVHTQMVWVVYPGWVNIQESLVTLRIDWRGRGKSRGQIAFEDFTHAQREAVTLDVAAALDFLSSQKEVDPARLGIVAEEFSVGPAVAAGARDHRVRVLVLISGSLDEKAIEALASSLARTILYVVSKEDRRGLDGFSRAFSLNENPQSDLWIQDGLGVGLAMASVWRNRYPDQPVEKAIDFTAGRWLVNRLRALGRISEVTLQTPDGWTLYASLGLPDAVENGETVPAVILLPTALSDRSSYHKLQRALVANKIAFINLDWRGIGKSTNKGSLVDMPLSEMPKALDDVREAYRFLASRKGINPERIAVVGSAYGAKLAMNAAKNISGLKAVVMLTPVVKPQDLANDLETLAAINRPLFLLTGDGFGDSTKKFAEIVTSNTRNAVRTYPGAILGHSLLALEASLESELIRWLKDQLGVRRTRDDSR
jgi:dienelactone hydrolase